MKKILYLCTCMLLLMTHGIQAQSKFKTVNYLNSITGKFILSGQHNDQKTRYNGTPTNENYWTNYVNQLTGKYPALYSCDFLFNGDGPARWAITYEAERQWNAGAAVNIMWHTCPPIQGEVCGWDGGVISSLNASQWSQLLTNGTALNTTWKSRIDQISVYLQYLEDKGVEVMWRPLHEQNQTVFWWNSGGAANTKALWQMTHDYMTTTKGLTNLIWVWDLQDLSTNFGDYNPGVGYYDIAALDIYGDGHTNTNYYTALNGQSNGKPIALGETFKMPTQNEFNNQPNMSFFMVWAYGLLEDYNSPPQQTNTVAEIQACYNNPRVITRDEMPGWNNVTAPQNLATGKTVTVSSNENTANTGNKAVDGSYSTRWSSLYSDAQWLSVDLGTNYSITRVKINWEAAYGKDYTVQGSADGTNWTTIKSIIGNTSLTNDHTGLSGSFRYVRINGTLRGTVYGYSIFELEVYGALNQAPTISITAPVVNAVYNAPASVTIAANASDTDGSIAKVDFYNGTTLLNSDNSAPYSFTWTNVTGGNYIVSAKATDNIGAVSSSQGVAIVVNTVVPVPLNLATGKTINVSSNEDAVNTGTKAVDGSYTTRWSSLYTDAQWLSVDLGANYSINRVKISWEAAYGKDYTVQGSLDGTTWTTIKSIVGNTLLTNDHTGLSGTFRFVRINGTARGTVYGYSIFELEVYGTANQAPSVSLTAPANNSSSNAPASITISASASDSDGSISKVEFFNGSTLLNSDITAPYNFVWTNVGAGTYMITAKATDNGGAVTTSTPINVTVNSIVVPSTSTKVVAYVANWVDLNTYSNSIDYSKLTHINIAFENPNSNGDLSFTSGDAALISKAHANNVKVFVSIGGGGSANDPIKSTFFSLISDSRRASFVAKLLAYLNANNFDGLDVDLEGPAINGDYGKFITDLSGALKPAGKGLSAALSQGYGGGNVPSTTFAYFDFINIMAYDAVGPWDTSNPGQHSSYSFAQSNLQYWLGRGLPKSKAVLGLPFYGYGFGADAGEWTYSQVLAKYPGTENLDQAGNTIWYNGIPTIKAKVNYAIDQQIAGVMIWELSQDVSGPRSLLLAIDQAIKSRSNPVPSNLATGKYVTVSSTEDANTLASNAVDGNYATRWSSLYSDAQWLTVDLGASYDVNRVKISWEAAYGKDYRITASSDGINWITLKTVVGNTTLTNDHTGLSGTCRYVSINGSARGTAYGYSIFELEVYGNTAAVVNPPIVSNPCGAIPAYKENGGYSAGSLVTAGGRQYECRPFPYSGWCNGASYAYGPGTGSFWQDAWLDRGVCNSTARIGLNTETNVYATSISVSPNPAIEFITIHSSEQSTVRIFNAQGLEVVPETTVIPEGYISIKDLPSGIYFLKINSGFETLTKTIIKTQ